ncbi:MAG: DUF4386 domain-containing protein [Lysobacter sp.]
MTSAKRVGRIIGMLLLVQLATGLIVPYVFLLPLTTPPAGFLETAAGMAAQVRLNVFLLFVGGAVSVGISVAAWPVVRERSYRLGLWLLVLAVVNFTLQIVENAHWLTLLSVSQAYAEAGAADAGHFQSIGIAVRSAFKWTHYSHIFVVVAWLFTLYCLLFRCAMVPGALAAIGMVASVLHFTGITLPAFAGYRMPFPELFGMPLGLANLVLAAWLMTKGFKEPYATPGAEAHRVEVSGS